MPAHEEYLQRALQLASLGGTAVQPNPQVGAVLVHAGRIVAEGWHQRYGGPHAEVHCLQHIDDPELLRQSTLYVSLEPCNHQGKTPPCVDLILAKGIRQVVVGCTDPNPKVSGQGIARLRAAGVAVTLAADPQAFIAQNRAFWVNQTLQRPYVVLKLAVTTDGFMGLSDQRLLISGAEAQRYGHSLRARCQAILVGSGTVLADDPALTLRHHPGQQPLRLVLDRSLRVPPTARLLTDGLPTMLLNATREEQLGAVHVHRVPFLNDLHKLLHALYKAHHVGSILVEGGRTVLTDFLQYQAWDELHLLQSQFTLRELLAQQGIKAHWPEPALAPATAVPMPYILGAGITRHSRDGIRAMGTDTLFCTFEPDSPASPYLI